MERKASLCRCKKHGQYIALSQYMLGTMYYNGVSWCEKDLKRAKELIKKAADQGYVPAKKMLREVF